MSKLIFNSAFIEARYNKSLLFEDLSKLQLIIRRNVEDFPFSDYNKDDKALVLRNNTKMMLVSVFDNRFVIEATSPKTYENFKAIANKIMREIVSALDIIKFNRFGLCSLRGVAKDNINAVDSYIKDKFLKFNENDLNKLGSDFLNFTLSFNFKTNDYGVRLSLCPANYQRIEINGSNSTTISTTQVLVDSDIYQEGILDVEKVIAHFVRDASNINSSNIDSFIESVGVLRDGE